MSAAILAALVAVGVASPILLSPPAAEAAAPVVTNSGSTANWVESFASEDDGNRAVSVTFLVRHDPNRRITGIVRDFDFDGTDNTASLGASAVSAQYLGSPGTNRLATSVVRDTVTPPEPGFSCGFLSGTRRVDVPLRYRVIDDTGQRTTTTFAYTWRVIEDEQCTGADDFAVLESVGQSASSATPGQAVNFNFVCDDADASGSNDRCDYISWRWRRLNDGAVSGQTSNDAEDNTSRSFGVTFPSRGVYVVEAQLCGEDSCPDGTYWRIGSVQVNDSAAPTGTMSFSGAQPSSPPSVNIGDPVTAVAGITGTGGPGAVQVIEWDATNDGSLERTEYTVPSGGGSVAHSSVTGAQLQQSVATASAGLKSVRARLYDNGALDAADNERRSSDVVGQLRVNAPPAAANVSAETTEDAPVDVALAASDPDNQPAPLTYEIVSGPAHGSASLTGGTVTYTPAADFNGTDSFTYRAADGPATGAWTTSNVATVSVTVTPVNDAPVASDVDVATNEDDAVTFTPPATDVDGDTLTFSASTTPAHGTVSSSGGALTYTPEADFNGTDSFVFTADDGNGGSSSATVNLVVNPVNDPAVADDQAVTTDEDTPIDITLTGSDIDGDPLAFNVADGPEHGTVTGSGGDVTYVPAPNFNGTDSFTFTVDDGNGPDTGTVDITVAPVNDAPVADGQAVAATEDTPLGVTLTGSDVDGDTLTFSIAGGPAHGTVTIDGSTATYTPDSNYHGPDSFEFTVDDGNGLTATATVDIAVTAVNDAPVADDQSATTDEDTSAAITLTGSDVDGDALSFAVVDAPVHGTLSGVAPDVTYTPAANFNGGDSFTFQVDDGNGGTAIGTVSITVAAVNDAPVAHADNVATDEDVPVDITLTASDVEDDHLTYTIASGPAHGTLSGEAPNLTYTPAPNYDGSDSFAFAVDDGNGGTDSAVVAITIAGDNDPPTADAQSVATAEDTAVAVTLTGSDPELDDLTFAIADAPLHGTLSGDAPNLVYTPHADFNGDDEFTFTADDGDGGVDTATVSISVAPVNDAPVAHAQSVVTEEDTAVGITLSGADIDGDELAFAIVGEPAHGTLSGSGSSVTYTPNPDFTGTDALTFSVDDGNGGVDTAVVAITVDATPLIETVLAPEAAVVDLVPGAEVNLTFRSALSRADNSAPLAGRTVVFVVGGDEVCSAVTDNAGAASCGGAADVIAALVAGAYTARFDGDADFAPSSADGPLVVVAGSRVL